MAITQKLRPYQVEIGRAVFDSIYNRKGLTFTVEIARQGGKNELSAQIELLLLTLYMNKGGNAIKCSPTFKPQALTSILRLEERLAAAGYFSVLLILSMAGFHPCWLPLFIIGTDSNSLRK